MRTSSSLKILAGLIGLSVTLAQSHAAQGVQLRVDDSPLPEELREATSYAKVIQQVAPSVVNISTSRKIELNRNLLPWLDDPILRRYFGERFGEGEEQPLTRRISSLGSGVIVTEDGYILTNDHVIDGADEITVILGKKDKEYKAKVVGRDPATDLAVLKVEATGLKAIIMGNSDLLQVGDTVLALGNPFGLSQTVTSGIVSALGRGDMGIERYEDFVQTDAAVNPGNSGGPLVDVLGRLVGVNTAILSRTGGNQGISFAIPVNMTRYVMEMLISEGRVSRGFLGVRPQDVDQSLAKAFGVEQTGGALVAEVVKGSAAAEAGLEAGDIVVEINGKPVRDSRALRLMVGVLLPGTKVEVKLLRNGQERTFNVNLKEMEDEVASSEESEQPAEDEVLKEVGVADLNGELRTRFEIPREVEGAVVISVEVDSPPYEAGLREGDVLLEINRRKIENAEDAVSATHGVTDKTILLRIWSRGIVRFLVVDETETP